MTMKMGTVGLLSTAGVQIRPHILEPLVTGRLARVTTSTGPSSEDVLISTGQVGLLRFSLPT
jgi:hypothetical protein